MDPTCPFCYLTIQHGEARARTLDGGFAHLDCLAQYEVERDADEQAKGGES